MRRWSEVAERVAATTRTSEKTALLAEYLGGLTAAELPIAVVFLTGRPFAEADQRAAGLGWAAIATTVTDLAHVPRSALGEAYDRSSDLGRAVADVLTLAEHAPDPAVSPSLPEVAAAYAAIEAASGPTANGIKATTSRKKATGSQARPVDARRISRPIRAPITRRAPCGATRLQELGATQRAPRPRPRHDHRRWTQGARRHHRRAH